MTRTVFRAILILCSLREAASACPSSHESSACLDSNDNVNWWDDSAECCICSTTTWAKCESGYTYSGVPDGCDGNYLCGPVQTCCVPDSDTDTTSGYGPPPTPLPTPVPTPTPTMTEIATLGAATPWSLTIVILMIIVPIAVVLVLHRQSPLRLQHMKNMFCPCLRMNPKYTIRGIVSDSDADAVVEILSDPPPNLGLTIGRAHEGGPCFIKAITPDSPLFGILVTNDVFTSINDADARALDPSQIEARLSSNCLLSVAITPTRGKATSSSRQLDIDAKANGCLKLCANVYTASNVGKVQILEGLDIVNNLMLVVLHFAAIIVTFTQRKATGARARRAQTLSCALKSSNCCPT